MALTTIGITNLRPKKADYRVADGGGLYILVRPNGSKLWRYDYRLDGSRRTHSIGEWGEGAAPECEGFRQRRSDLEVVADCRLHHDDLAARAHHREHTPFRSGLNKTTSSYIIEITTQYCE